MPTRQRGRCRTSLAHDRALCPVTAVEHQVPPADQTYAFAVQLDRALAERPSRGGGRTYVDLEGEAVWLQAYARERARGAREQDARASVIATVAAAAR